MLTTALSRALPAGRSASAAAVVAPLAATMLVAGLLVARDPVPVVVGFGALAVLAAMMLRVEWAVLVYVAAEPFGDYLKSLSTVSVKVIGLLLFAAWLARLMFRTRPVALRHGAVYAAAALAAVALAATVLHPNGDLGAVVLGRYLSYIAVLVVLVDSMRSGLPPHRVAFVYVGSCTAAAAVGVVVFLTSGVDRAGGPMADPNDFAFFLISAVPLALALGRISPRRRVLPWLAAILLTLASLLTFSRGGALGLAAMLGYALITRQLRWRAVLGGALAAAVVAVCLTVAVPSLLQSSLAAKQHVAQQNIEDRFITWTMAAEMTADHPVLGVGPAGFATDFDSYVGPRVVDPAHLDVAHQMFLDVSSELGLLGLGAFVGMLAAGAAGARRAARRTGPSAVLAGSVCTALVGTAVAACFLSEQYYLPIWLLVALGAALDPAERSGA